MKGKVDIVKDSASSQRLGVEEAVDEGGMGDRIIMAKGEGEGIKREAISERIVKARDMSAPERPATEANPAITKATSAPAKSQVHVGAVEGEDWVDEVGSSANYRAQHPNMVSIPQPSITPIAKERGDLRAEGERVGVQSTPACDGVRSDGSEREGEEAVDWFICEWGRVVDKAMDGISMR